MFCQDAQKVSELTGSMTSYSPAYLHDSIEETRIPKVGQTLHNNSAEIN